MADKKGPQENEVVICADDDDPTGVQTVHDISVYTGWDKESILRGHFPLETSLLRDAYEKNTGKKIDGEVLCPFFKEAVEILLAK